MSKFSVYKNNILLFKLADMAGYAGLLIATEDGFGRGLFLWALPILANCVCSVVTIVTKKKFKRERKKQKKCENLLKIQYFRECIKNP